MKVSVEERFWSKIEFTDTCWLWCAPTETNGYGQFFVCADGKKFHRVMAHRYAYESLVGPVPGGKELDHLCRVRRCVNPFHVEPVTHKENILRGKTIAAANVGKTHCPAGHVYSTENVSRRQDGRRSCKTCNRNQSNLRYQTRRLLVSITG